MARTYVQGSGQDKQTTLRFPLLLTAVQGKKPQIYSSPGLMLPVLPIRLGSTLASVATGVMQRKADPLPLMGLWFAH